MVVGHGFLVSICCDCPVSVLRYPVCPMAVWGQIERKENKGSQESGCSELSFHREEHRTKSWGLFTWLRPIPWGLGVGWLWRPQLGSMCAYKCARLAHAGSGEQVGEMELIWERADPILEGLPCLQAGANSWF